MSRRLGAVGRPIDDGDKRIPAAVRGRRVRACHAPGVDLGLDIGRGRRGADLAHRADLRQLARARIQPAGHPHLGAGGGAGGARHSATAARGSDCAAVPQDQGHPAAGLGHRAGSAERGHHRFRCGAVLRPAQLGEAARRPADHSDGGGKSIPRRPDHRAVPDGERLDDPPSGQGDPRGGLGLRKEARLPRHAYLQGAWRPGLLAAGAVAGAGQDRLALARRRHHRHGAELAGPRRADREVRHARAEALLPASFGQGHGGAVLLAHGADFRLGRRHHARRRLRHARAARGQGRRGHPRLLGQALHHAGPRGDAGSAWRSACSIRKTCWVAARISALPSRLFRPTTPESTSAAAICLRVPVSRTDPTGGRTSSSPWTG